MRSGTLPAVEEIAYLARYGATIRHPLSSIPYLKPFTYDLFASVLVYQVEELMKSQQLTKTEMARRMQTSRASLNRLLDPSNPSITLQTLERAAAALGKRLRIELV